jgi:hypothetical protein
MTVGLETPLGFEASAIPSLRPVNSPEIAADGIVRNGVPAKLLWPDLARLEIDTIEVGFLQLAAAHALLNHPRRLNCVSARRPRLANSNLALTRSYVFYSRVPRTLMPRASH